MMRKRYINGYRKVKKGRGLLNTLFTKLPFELHLPGGYQYCGPGTRLEKRLPRNDPGINKLDQSCKVYDIAYAKSKDLNERHKADKILEEAVSQRLNASDASLGEKMAALGVKGAMKIKRKLGIGLKKENETKKVEH